MERHRDFAPWWGPLTSRVALDHGGEIRGRVVLPVGADPGDFAVGVWVDQAALQHGRADSVYASVTAPLAADGTYRLRNVPTGMRTVAVQDRRSTNWRSSAIDIEVGSEPTIAADLTIDPDRRPRVAIDAARRLPPGCALRADIFPVGASSFDYEPVLCLDAKPREYGTPLDIARDADIVVDRPGRCEVSLSIVRWHAAELEFVEVPIDVEPREFEVRTDGEPTLVTVSSRFTETPR
ncbi:MAG: hypothetical protein WAT39_13945 [Planctomycetota bacterium]